MLIDSGYSLEAATQLASLIGISIILGRLLTGFIIDRFFAPRVAAILLTLSALGFLALAVGESNLIPLAPLLVGLSLGAELDLVVYLTSRYFPPGAYSRAFGLSYAAFLFGVAVSPVIYALLHRFAGDYALAFLLAAVLLTVSAFVFATSPPYPDQRPVQTGNGLR